MSKSVQMPLITLISDWGLTDHYLPMVKAKIYRLFPEAHILDITHQIPKFDTLRTAFILQHVYPECPSGSVHIIATDSIDFKKSAFLLVQHHDQYFIGSDNGVFSLLFPETPEAVFSIPKPEPASTFPAFECFAEVACKLIQGTPAKLLGIPTSIQNIKTLLLPVGRFKQDAQNQNIGATLQGSVNYIDSYENIFTNISKRDFEYFQKQFTHFEIKCYEPIHKISQTYTDVALNEVVALFAQDGYLQIAVNHANAAGLLGFSVKSQITIEFFNKSN